MSLAFNSVLTLIAFSLALAFWSGASATLFQTLVVALLLLTVAVAARQSDVSQLRRAISGITWILLLPALWIVLQLLPVPALLAHPVWSSANEASGDAWFGFITVDRGATTSALFAALAIAGLVLATIVVGRDRRRAELILLTLAAATTLLSLAAMLQDIAAAVVSLDAKISNAVAINIVGISLALNAAVLNMAFERRETRHQAATPFLAIGVASVAGIVIDIAALAHIGRGSSFAVMAIGVALLAMLIVIRRLDLGRWPIAILATAFFVGVIILLGFISLSRLPVDLNPDTQIPTITVRVGYSGVGPLEMEELVTRPIEQAVSAMSDFTSQVQQNEGAA